MHKCKAIVAQLVAEAYRGVLQNFSEHFSVSFFCSMGSHLEFIPVFEVKRLKIPEVLKGILEELRQGATHLDATDAVISVLCGPLTWWARSM